MKPYKILFEDPFILCLDKSPGVVVSQTETQDTKTIADYMKADFGIDLERGGVVHRLDKDTSGILIIAKTAQTLIELKRQFKERLVKKEYKCLVHGFLKEKGRIEGAIERNPGDREKFIVDLKGEKTAITDYSPFQNLSLCNQKIEEIFPDYSKIQLKKLSNLQYTDYTLLSCFPLTGRTHQIRVHLKYIGHPIVGDSKYAGRKTARLDKRWCPRQFLHATKIEFTHPQSGKSIVFRSELPDDLEKALEFLESRE